MKLPKKTTRVGRGVVEEMVGEEKEGSEVASINRDLSQQESRAGSNVR